MGKSILFLKVFLFMSVTPRLNLFFRNDVLSDTVLYPSLFTFIYADVVMLTLLRPRLLIKI